MGADSVAAAGVCRSLRLVEVEAARLAAAFIAPATTRDSICACAKWHDWKPITLVEAFRKMEEA